MLNSSGWNVNFEVSSTINCLLQELRNILKDENQRIKSVYFLYRAFLKTLSTPISTILKTLTKSKYKAIFNCKLRV